MDKIYYPTSHSLGQALLQRNWTLAAAESCTGGALARAVTQVPGSSAWFDRGFITYSNAAKMSMLDVKPEVIEEFGAVSKEVAYEMAVGVLKYSEANLSISITGIAGPSGGTPLKPVGTVWFGLALAGGNCECRKMQFASGRKHVRDCAVVFALKWLLQVVLR